MVGSNRPVILLAENRDSTRVALNKVLEATGYDAIVVERASEALSKEHRPLREGSEK
jgi:CheY-like chemotaxis protein